MYCPNCGNPSSTERKFCRFCGLNLELHAKMLAYQLPLAEGDKSCVSNEKGLQAQGRRHKTFRQVFRTLLLLSVTVLLTTWLTATGSYYVWGAGLILLVTGIVGVTLVREAPFLFHRPMAEPSVALSPERQPESLPSVTEHTTELLEAAQVGVSLLDQAHPREQSRS